MPPWPGQEPPPNQCPLASLLYCRNWATLSDAWCVPLLDCDWDWMLGPSSIMATIVRSDWDTKLTLHASSKAPVNVACSCNMCFSTILAARARQMASSKFSLQSLHRAAPMYLSKARSTSRPSLWAFRSGKWAMMRFLRSVLCGRVSCSMPNCCSRTEYCLTRPASLKTGASSILDLSMYVSNSARATLLLRLSVVFFLPFRACSAVVKWH